MKINFLRMQRQIELGTYGQFVQIIESFITLKTPYPMLFDQAAQWAEDELPGWEAICGSPINPDNGNVK